MELEPDNHQYEGVPGSGAEHLLIDLWEEVLGAMEGGNHAAVLLGVDYEKAFNRMEHAVCLKQLKLLGASPGSLSLVRAFLEGRKITITIDGQSAGSVPIRRGSTQGSVLGCMLYCTTTQQLTKDLRVASAGGEDAQEVRYFPGDESDENDVQFWEVNPAKLTKEPIPFLYVDDTTLF